MAALVERGVAFRIAIARELWRSSGTPKARRNRPGSSVARRRDMKKSRELRVES
jgi:hypothetical protein